MPVTSLAMHISNMYVTNCATPFSKIYMTSRGMLVSTMSGSIYAMHMQVLQMTSTLSGPAKLPYSAATMFLLAFVPPVYFHVMHPCIERVIAHARTQ